MNSWGKIGILLLLILALFTCHGLPSAQATGGAGAVFVPGPEMNAARNDHWSVSLPDGRLALFGGNGSPGMPGTPLNTAEIWNPATNNFILLTMRETRWHSACTRLNDGRYLLAGGYNGSLLQNSAEIFNPADNSFTDGGTMHQSRVDVGAAALTDGRVLVVGNQYLTLGELYDPAMKSFSLTKSLNTPRASPVILPTSDGKAVVLGGQAGSEFEINIDQVELYDPGTNSFSVLQPTLFAGEMGWQILCPTPWGSIPLDQQKMRGGRYLLLAARQINATTYQVTFFTFNPATKEIAKFSTTPTMGEVQRLPESPSLQVMVNEGRTKAYLLIPVGASQIRLLTVDLVSGSLTSPTGSYTLPSNYYVKSVGSAVLRDGRLFFTGGCDNVNNDNPIKKTLFALLSGDAGAAIDLLLLGN